jgi:hypothetical protein
MTMRVREATAADRASWDAFVDEQGGSFFHYFDWKQVHEAGGRQLTMVLVETAPSQIAGILPVVKENRLFYSALISGWIAGREGLVLRKGLSDNERLEAASALVEYVDARWSRRCSAFRLTETLAPADALSEEPTAALLHHGFRFRYDGEARLPCNFVLELRQPFEENVWKGCGRMVRQGARKAEESGVVVIEDGDFNHVGDFTRMLHENFRRHRTPPPSRDEIEARLSVFRDRSKLYVALLDGRPIVALLCHFAGPTFYLSNIGSYAKDTDDANKLCWKRALEDACSRGYRFADFGVTTTPGLAFFKERFRATRVPVRVYEKRYSIVRTMAEKTPVLFNNAWHDKGYLWRNRRLIWDRVVRI